jgi:hypothetical protein
MGSWNLTCAITRAPIRHKHPVRLIFLGMNPDINKHAVGRLYTTDDWAPLSFPLATTYDDNGWVSLQDDDDWAARMFLDSLSKGIDIGDVILKEGQKAPTTLTQALQLVRVCALRLKAKAVFTDNDITAVPVATMVIHEDAYQVLTKKCHDTSAPKLIPALSEYLSFLTHVERQGRAVFARLPHEASNHLIPFWFGGKSDSISPRVFGISSPSPVDVIHDIHAGLLTGASMSDGPMKQRIEAIAQMMVLQENMDAQAIPFAPTMNASDDFDIDLHRDIAALAQNLQETG